jgi:hypothetical protein
MRASMTSHDAIRPDSATFSFFARFTLIDKDNKIVMYNQDFYDKIEDAMKKVEEAGGKVTDLKGNYYNPYQPGIIATNGKIHDELIGVVNNEKQL